MICKPLQLLDFIALKKRCSASECAKSYQRSHLGNLPEFTNLNSLVMLGEKAKSLWKHSIFQYDHPCCSYQLNDWELDRSHPKPQTTTCQKRGPTGRTSCWKNSGWGSRGKKLSSTRGSNRPTERGWRKKGTKRSGGPAALREGQRKPPRKQQRRLRGAAPTTTPP